MSWLSIRFSQISILIGFIINNIHFSFFTLRTLQAQSVFYFELFIFLIHGLISPMYILPYKSLDCFLNFLLSCLVNYNFYFIKFSDQFFFCSEFCQRKVRVNFLAFLLVIISMLIFSRYSIFCIHVFKYFSFTLN